MYFEPTRYRAVGAQLAPKSHRQIFNHGELLLCNLSLYRALALPQDMALFEAWLCGNSQLHEFDEVSLAYCGHQFGHFNPTLGDGRAHLIAQLNTPIGRVDIQTKGSGPSQFSRGGDGLCALGPAVREYVMSHAIKSLGIPTTDCLAVLKTNETVYRDQVEHGALCVRVAKSHIRVGSFQFAALNDDKEMLSRLLDLSIETHFPEIVASGEERIVQFLELVCEKQAQLVLNWMRVGFVHGVMNTDNTLISGETIDYGPCAMLEQYSLDAVFSSIDRNGRYAFGRQANMAHWNCARLAESLLPLFDDEERAVSELTQALDKFVQRFNPGYEQLWFDKLGLSQNEVDAAQLVVEFKQLLTEYKWDYTNTFAGLTALVLGGNSPFVLPTELLDWQQRWLSHINTASAAAIMVKNNPAIIPRNHLMEQVISLAKQHDFTLLNTWFAALSAPYNYEDINREFIKPDSEGGKGYKTFCGT
ncbi:Selenoprotein O and cysteine-containing homologs [Pseudoalteromonas luteoviolacea B = ATCC 29581]|nr:Selenoprotein O and cysteine-containing homologs [Pseudoalteromonas luteoviolacea B = ATCC 29581]